MLNRRAYSNMTKHKSNLSKPFERMTDNELIELYYILINNQHNKNDRGLKALNKFLLQTGKIEFK